MAIEKVDNETIRIKTEQSNEVKISAVAEELARTTKDLAEFNERAALEVANKEARIAELSKIISDAKLLGVE